MMIAAEADGLSNNIKNSDKEGDVFSVTLLHAEIRTPCFRYHQNLPLKEEYQTQVDCKE